VLNGVPDLREWRFGGLNSQLKQLHLPTDYRSALIGNFAFYKITFVFVLFPFHFTCFDKKCTPFVIVTLCMSGCVYSAGAATRQSHGHRAQRKRRTSSPDGMQSAQRTPGTADHLAKGLAAPGSAGSSQRCPDTAGRTYLAPAVG